jgi:hypothetical protein
MAAASIIASVVTGGTNSHQTVAEELNVIATDFITQGIVAPTGFTPNTGSGGTGSFCVNQDSSPDMGVTVLLGQAYVAGTPSSQDAQVLRARMTSNYTGYTINANSSGSTKYDWIYLQLSATNANTPSSAADNVITLVTSRSSSNTSDNGSPPTYGLLLAVVTVANGASSITNANIADKRIATILASSSTNAVNTGWNALSYALTYSANNGSKEFAVTTPYNLTTLLSPGMRLSIARSVTPPTQCMAFVSASSQYATKASPSGITFTGPFTCEAWVYLNSYTGLTQVIVGRSDIATGGFFLFIDANGRPAIEYGASSSFTNFIAYQSVPLNRWVHIAGVVTSVASKTGLIYINGTSVSVQSTLSAATTLAQTSNLSVGGGGAGVANSFLNGYVSEARVWSAAQSAANIQANMGINLVGTESNLVALYQGNGVFTDATSNANNLTATGGAIATQAANPYNATEYAVIRSVTYSAPNTTITMFTDDYGTIPNQTLNTPQYSTVREPFGYPLGFISDKIWGMVMWAANQTNTATSTGTQLTGATMTVTIPTGGKKMVIKAAAALLKPGAGTAVLDAYWGSTPVGRAQAETTTNGSGVNLLTYPVVLTAGSQTVSLDMWETSAGTCTLGAATQDPAVFTLEEA